jgi:hypothetical protein
VTTWGEWRRSHPDTEVLRPEPKYGAFYDPPDLHSAGEDFLPDSVAPTVVDPDPRRKPNDLVYGVAVEASRKAYPIDALERKEGVVDDEVAGVPVTVWFDPSSSAVVGFVRRAGGLLLSFERNEAGAIVDRETGSRWNLDGEAVTGPLRGGRLRPLHGVRAEWYGWSAVHEETEIAR